MADNIFKRLLGRDSSSSIAPKSALKQIGVSQESWGGWTMRGDEFLTELQGQRGIRTYRQMADNDATIASILFAIEMGMRNVDWRIDVPEDANTKDEDVEFVDSVMKDMEHSFNDFISASLSFLLYGWSYSEIVYKLREGPQADDPSRFSMFSDGRLGIRKISHRPQDTLHRWVYKDDELQGMEQITTTRGTVFIPLNKSIHFRTVTTSESPEGRSILRGAYRSWFFMRNIELIESVGIERELNGLPVIEVPMEYLEAAANGDPQAIETVKKYEEAATRIKLSEQAGVVIPSDVYTDDTGKPTNVKKVSLSLLASQGTRNIDTDAIIKRNQGNIMRSVLADFFLLGTQGGSGSYALAQDRSSLFQDALGGWLDMMSATLNRQLIRPLWMLNGLPVEDMPKLQHGPITHESLERLAGYVESLSRAGMPLFPDEALEKFFRDKGDFPPASEELIRDPVEQAARMTHAVTAAAADAAPSDDGKGNKPGDKKPKPKSKAPAELKTKKGG